MSLTHVRSVCARCEKIADKRATRRGREDEVIDADAPLSVATENWFAIGDNSFDGEKKKKTDEKVEAKRILLVQENVEREVKKTRDKWTGKSGEEKMAKEEGKGPLWRPYCIPLTGRPSDLDPISHRDGALLLPLPIPQTQT